jgi:O-acetyl-ADP-ribose deacetylase (regulator of RNase III)
VALGAIEETGAAAILRPVSAEWDAVTPAMRRLEMAAGPQVLEQCERQGELPVGSAVITGAGDLPAQFMVHAIVRSRDEPVSVSGVRRALQNGLRRLSEWAIDSVAVAPLGTGAGNLDAEESAETMVPAILEHMREAAYPKQVELIVESEYERDAFARALALHTAAADHPADESRGG